MAVDGAHPKDEHYVLALCDEILGSIHTGQKRFQWLRGDPSLKSQATRTLPVDGFWEDLGLVVEFQERQHSESVPFFDQRVTACGLARGEQRKLYDHRKATLVPENGYMFLAIAQGCFPLKKRKIDRNHRRDLEIVRQHLAPAMPDEVKAPQAPCPKCRPESVQ